MTEIERIQDQLQRAHHGGAWHGPALNELLADVTPEQAAAVRREYGFKGEFLCVETRKALEFYFDRRWGIDQKGARLEKSRTDYVELQPEQDAEMNERS